MLRLENPSNVCYANAGMNLLLSSPLVTRFLSTLPKNNAELDIVRRVATLEPNSVGNLKDLRKTVTENTIYYFNDDTKKEDTCEWIDALYDTIQSLLDHNIDMQTYWCNLFKWNSTITYECCDNRSHESQQTDVNHRFL